MKKFKTGYENLNLSQNVKNAKSTRNADFEMENTDTSEKNGYEPISKNREDELNLHTDGEIPTGENENYYLTTESTSIRRSNRKRTQPSRYGECHKPKTFGREK